MQRTKLALFFALAGALTTGCLEGSLTTADEDRPRLILADGGLADADESSLDDDGSDPGSPDGNGGPTNNGNGDGGGSSEDGGAGGDDSGDPPQCGDGVVEGGEICDPCEACDDGNACTVNVATGSADTCDVVCTFEPITACADGDGCCPAGCDQTNDDDCSATCGDGVVDDNETCDGMCPTSCDDDDACTIDMLTGSAENCNVACSRTNVTMCIDDDGCCPANCDATNDEDCAAVCGNGIREGGERCDGDCPSSCDDGDRCTTDTLMGSAAQCDARCVYAPVACVDGDGCCPAGCTADNDSDCIDCRDPAKWPSAWAQLEDEVVTEVNIARSSSQNCGVNGTFPAQPPLTMDPKLREAARCHSLDMAENDFFSHTGSNGSSFSQRAGTAAYDGFANTENIGAGYGSAAAVVAGWVDSDGHCRNLMNASADEIGIGYVSRAGTQWTRYWTMMTGIAP